MSLRDRHHAETRLRTLLQSMRNPGIRGAERNQPSGGLPYNLSDTGVVVRDSLALATETLTVVQLPSYRSSASTSNASANSLTITKPTGVVENDIMIAGIGSDTDTMTITPPAGWTTLGKISQSGVMLETFWKKAGASEGANYTFNYSATVRSVGLITAYLNCASSPVDVENGQTTSSGTSHSTPSVTTTVDNCRLVCVFCAINATAWTAGGSLTERVDQASSTVMAICLDDEFQGTAGSTGAKSATSDVAGIGCAQITALKP